MLALDVLDDLGEICISDEHRPDTSTVLPFEQYDVVVVGLSGGKDSLAAALQLFDLGVSKHKIEFWHQHVDGAPGAPGFMDWPITEDYCRKLAHAFDVPILGGY